MTLVSALSCVDGPEVSMRVSGLLADYLAVRAQTLALVSPLSPEDMMVQSCAEASPAKWHLAHTTWFFETFVLSEYAKGYKPFHPDFRWLFNSYYNSLSAQPEKKLRGSFSRPGVEEILSYRRHVESALVDLLSRSDLELEAKRRVVLGLHHEQQHQELLCYDIKNAFWSNPLHPSFVEGADALGLDSQRQELMFIGYEGGLVDVGHDGVGFAFDNECPSHAEFLQPFQMGSRLITCGEYAAFMDDRGYERPELWLSDGWDLVKRENWKAPLYWHRQEGESGWSLFTLRGNLALEMMRNTPVCHVSYFEADAYANWAKKRLPTEAEWEVVAKMAGVLAAPDCNLLESGMLHPLAATGHARGRTPQQLLGDAWEWTRSAYLGYPGYKAGDGALGEYNGKFMSSQMVLRGGSAVTPASHIRNTYRNFFPPSARWQFSSIRLAQNA